MGIEIRIKIDLTPWQKKLVRGAVVTGAVIAALGIGVALAGPIDTTWIVQGNPLTAAQLKSDLDGLQTQVAALQAFQAQATADGGYSLGATYCGMTAATTGALSGPGSLTGYASAKGQCQGVAACSPTAAHMCTADELIRTRALGIAAPNGWYSNAAYAYYPGPEPYADCDGWTSSSNQPYGPVWNSSPSQDDCAATQSILCCN